MSGFFSDFFGGVTDSVATKEGSARGNAGGDSYGTKAGQAFFSFASDYLKGGRTKAIIEKKLQESRTAQSYIQDYKARSIQEYIRNPSTWAMVIGVALVVGFIGFSIGKR